LTATRFKKSCGERDRRCGLGGPQIKEVNILPYLAFGRGEGVAGVPVVSRGFLPESMS
jgi:hypothetical protein